jgi:hypothetical protein
MKKFFALACALVLVAACDDGDISFNEFNLEPGDAVNCTGSNIYYRVDGTQAYILELAPSNLIPETGENGEFIVREVTLSSGDLIYRAYSSDIPTQAGSFFCTDIPPTSPNITEEWNATGTIAIFSDKNTNTNGELIGYTHTITLQDVTFTQGESTIVVQDRTFGNITTGTGISFNFTTSEETPVLGCDENELLYRISGREALVIDFPAGVFDNTSGSIDNIDLASAEDEFEMYLEYYSGNASESNICSLIDPISPVVEQRWRASAGNVIIETTESDVTPGTFNHKIWLKNVVLTQTDTNQSINLAELLTDEERQDQDDNGVFIGTYVTN